MKLYSSSLQEILVRYEKREATPFDLIGSLFERIQSVEKKVNAFITLPDPGILKDVKKSRMKIQESEPPLAGIPVAIKDNIVTHGIPTTCGSKILENFISPYDATAVRHLKENGAIVFGKTNLDEFGMGSSTENSAFKITKNPWDLERVPGGSSGGSAAAVAAGMCPAALGSDTGGSVRQPASLCGIVGMKPTYGRISRFGLVAFGSSLDQIGILTRTVTDNALLLNVLAGHDDQDSTSVSLHAENFAQCREDDIKGIRIGFPSEYFGEGLSEEVKKSILKAIGELEKGGAEVEEISLPHTEYAIPTYYLTATAEASSNLARYDGVRYGLRDMDEEQLTMMYMRSRNTGFGREVKRRIMLGTYGLSAGYYDAYYLKAQKVRTLIRKDFIDAFKKVDLIITPTTPTTAFRIGEKTDDPLQMYLSDIYTVTINLAGVPALSVPCGFSMAGLPIGLQMIGNFFKESELYRAAFVLECMLDCKNRIAEP